MNERLDGQVAVVTGGVRGIGLGIAARLAAEGCRVVIWDRDVKGFDAEAAGFAPAALHATDVSDFGAAFDLSGGRATY
jgi:3-oxoacyl-[acyl-carrier protein] reductase